MMKNLTKYVLIGIFLLLILALVWIAYAMFVYQGVYRCGMFLAYSPDTRIAAGEPYMKVQAGESAGIPVTMKRPLTAVMR